MLDDKTRTAMNTESSRMAEIMRAKKPLQDEIANLKNTIKLQEEEIMSLQRETITLQKEKMSYLQLQLSLQKSI